MLLISSCSFSFAQNDQSQPTVGYTLEVDLKNLSSFKVTMRIRGAADTFRLAMMAHPEYDDRFWRYVRDFQLQTKDGKGTVWREDSALWRIIAPEHDLVINYKISLPTPPKGQRAAWRPFLSPTGGLVGGPHSFLYVVGATRAPSFVTLKIPATWKSATGLQSTMDGATFFAESAAALVDSPILVGQFKSWHFTVDQVPHRVVFWPLPGAITFDSATLVNYVQRFVLQAEKLFGSLPYREYSFLLQDGAFGALEHGNSSTLGVSSSGLAKNIGSYLGEITHEYFHAWNLVRIRPVEFGDIDYKTPPLSRGLWWSEGMTMFYADLLSRRAQIPTEDSSRISHLEELMGRYYSSPGNSKVSLEQASLAAFGPPGMMGDFNASTHLQGELLGTMLDLIIQDATAGRFSIDNVMQKMMSKFSVATGFTNKDIENLIQEVCSCNVQQFFNDYFYGNKPIDFNMFLELAGLHSNVLWRDAVDDAGKISPDLRIYAFQPPGYRSVKLGITDPSGCWGKAGIHTGDVILSVNKVEVKSPSDFRQEIRKSKIGDLVSLKVLRQNGTMQISVPVKGYRQAVVRIEQIKTPTERQQKLRTAWIQP